MTMSIKAATDAEEARLEELVDLFDVTFEQHHDLESIVDGIHAATTTIHKASNMFRILSELLSPSWKPNMQTEGLLCINLYEPITAHFLSKLPDALHNGNDKELQASKQRKAMQQGRKAIGRKPDRSIEVMANGTTYTLLMSEIKAEEHSKGRPDLTKLAAMMKDNCDAILSKQYPRSRYFSSGILQEGAKTSIFVMNSPSKHFYVFYLQALPNQPSYIR